MAYKIIEIACFQAMRDLFLWLAACGGRLVIFVNLFN